MNELTVVVAEPAMESMASPSVLKQTLKKSHAEENPCELEAPRPHHLRDSDCIDRPAYRDGRKKTAVKVFTPHHESKHLLVFNVPKLNLSQELG